MPAAPVHWFQGMFLRPHHFQAADRHWHYLSHTAVQWDHQFYWGLRAIDLDREALANNTLVVRSVKARLRDGTLVEAESDDLQPVPLQAAFQRARLVNVFLRVPVLRTDGGNVQAPMDQNEDVFRFRRQHEAVEDDNQRGNPQSLDFRRLNVSVFVHEQPTPPALTGYEYLKVAQLERGDRANAVPQLAARYIPPVLACDAWPALANDVLQTVFHRVGSKIEVLAGMFRGGPGLAQAEGRVVQQLGLLNEAYLLLHILAFVKGVHPLTAYLELCRLVGQLAILGPERRATELPPAYDHDDLGKCFYKVRDLIDALLELIEIPHYEREPFRVAGAQLHATIKPEWVQRQWPMFIGVHTSVEPTRCVYLLQGRLEMKVASKERVARVFRGGGDSLGLVHVSKPETFLPDDQVYFEIGRTPQSAPLWDEVLQERKLAIQFNQNMKADDSETANADGERRLRMRFGEAVEDFEFTLFAVRPDAKAAPPGAPAPRR